MRYAALITVIALLVAPATSLAAVYDTTWTPAELRKAYDKAKPGKKLKVLIVAGHDDQFSGATFGGLREADLNLGLAEKIEDLLENDKNLEVRMARTAQGYDQELVEYFTDKREQVQDFIDSHKDRMERYIESGKATMEEGVPHGTAPSEAALRLYAINKWASDNDYHIVLHIHFNDTARYNSANPGPYTGFAVYVPEGQFGNARASQAVGRELVESLLGVHYTSTLPQESAGLIEDQELIAVGAYNTQKAASVLVEYAYIYEQRVQNPLVRERTLSDMAEATAQGLQNFLN